MAVESEKASQPVTTSEAYHLLFPLKGRFKNTRIASYKIFKDTLDYTERFSKIKDKGHADELRQRLTALGLTPDEIAVLGSLFPQSADEAKICSPSISRLDDKTIDAAIEKFQEYA